MVMRARFSSDAEGIASGGAGVEVGLGERGLTRLRGAAVSRAERDQPQFDEPERGNRNGETTDAPGCTRMKTTFGQLAHWVKRGHTKRPLPSVFIRG